MKKNNHIMGRNRIFIEMVVVIVLILVFATKLLSNQNMKSNVNNKIELKAIITDGGNRVELSIYNTGNETINFGLEYEIQIYQGYVWKKYTDEIAVNAIGIQLLPNKSYVQIIELDNINIDMRKTYRIKKVIDGIEYYSNEFIIK